MSIIKNNMRYEELKKFDLNSIKSEDEAIKWKDTVIASDMDDKLKYVNFLRWQQFNQAGFKYMNRIVQFLSFDELIDFEKENSNLITGDTEDLVMLVETPKDEKLANPVYIDGKEYSVKTVLEDDFESIMIVTDREGKLYKFGFIVLSRLQGLELYAYELYEESQEYYKQVVDAKVGTKINVYCDIVGENQVIKTFKKSDLLIEEKSFVLATKSNKGIMSPVTKEGTFSILKKEEVLASDGISEDRLANQISKYQNEMKEKLGFSQTDIDNATKRSMEEEECCPTTKKKKYTKDDFIDNFKFSKEYNFSVVSPTSSEDYEEINPLTHTVLELNTDTIAEDGRPHVSGEYVDEIYALLYTLFGINEYANGIWAIENTKLDRVVRRLVKSGAKVEFVEDNASDFLKRFIRLNKDRIMSPKMALNIVKTIRTQKDVLEFAKDSGTELYVQIGQVMTSVLEGTQRLYGEGHMVFDSNHKLIICKYENLDLYEASEYAIDNGYENFYVIEKDKFQQYDAWFKETLKTKVDEEPTEQKPVEKTESKGFEPVQEDVILFDAKIPTDIVLVGDLMNGSDFSITDDEASYSISSNNKVVVDFVNTTGFVKIVSAKEFILNYKEVGDHYGNEVTSPGDLFSGDYSPAEFYLIRNYMGKVRLKMKLGDGTFFPTSELKSMDEIQHDTNLKTANKGQFAEILVDFESDINPVQIDEQIFNELS